jgi:hypothetical protein
VACVAAAAGGSASGGARAGTCDPGTAGCITLRIFVDGNHGVIGGGTISSSDGRFNCRQAFRGDLTGACVSGFSGGGSYSETLTVTPDEGNRCTNLNVQVNAACQTTVTFSANSVADVFLAPISYPFTATKSGSGTGTVTSTPGDYLDKTGISCGSVCSDTFYYLDQVTLTASPDAGSALQRWTGACAGQGATCTLTVKGPTATEAVFGPPGSSPPPSSGPPPPASSNAVQAQLVAVAVGRSATGKRLVEVSLEVGEPISADLALARGKSMLAHKYVGRVEKGPRVLLLGVPARVTKGGAALKITLANASGTTRAFSRRVALPAQR